jgi:hypothetical protein
MIIAVSYALALLGPDLAALADCHAGRMPLGLGDYVGTVRLADPKGRPVVVRLFVDDSDAVAEREVARGRSALAVYPNSLDLYAVYRAGGGKWEHRRLASYARVKFVRVKERTAEAAVLELRPAWRVDLKDRKAGRDVDAPFTHRLTVKGSVPVLDDLAAEVRGRPDTSNGSP